MGTMVSDGRSDYGVNCVRCDNELIAPEKSENMRVSLFAIYSVAQNALPVLNHLNREFRRGHDDGRRCSIPARRIADVKGSSFESRSPISNHAARLPFDFGALACANCSSSLAVPHCCNQAIDNRRQLAAANRPPPRPEGRPQGGLGAQA